MACDGDADAAGIEQKARMVNAARDPLVRLRLQGGMLQGGMLQGGMLQGGMLQGGVPSPSRSSAPSALARFRSALVGHAMPSRTLAPQHHTRPSRLRRPSWLGSQMSARWHSAEATYGTCYTTRHQPQVRCKCTCKLILQLPLAPFPLAPFPLTVQHGAHRSGPSNLAI
jgi:hypothetical protein